MFVLIDQEQEPVAVSEDENALWSEVRKILTLEMGEGNPDIAEYIQDWSVKGVNVV